MTDRARIGGETALACLAAVLVLCVTCWAYWPGHEGPALLDDRTNILDVGELSVNPQFAWDYVVGNQSGPLGRPVSMASFVLEKVLLGGGIATSKRVNILLHLCNGALVMWLFWLMFRYIAAPGYRWFAVVLGAAWLLSPLYVSTVLYIVQRMAMLSTSFMLISCIAYFYWRMKLLRGQFSALLLAMVLAGILLAVFAKENGILVVPVILLLECLWFQFAGDGRPVRTLQYLFLGLIGLGTVAVFAGVIVGFQQLSAGFVHRDFTMAERLLTQGRILWDYVGQLFFLDVLRMGIYHDDIIISKSLSDPSQTLWAAAGWLAVGLGTTILLLWEWGRYLALGVAWFLLGHSIESSILPLELYFEHRNYFPGIGLFLFLGVALSYVVGRWPQLLKPVLVYLLGFVVWLASMTSSQVQVWSSHPLLILNNVNAHPNSYRANADMAVQMANLGELGAARFYSERTFVLSSDERSGDHDIRDMALACIANRSVDPALIAGLGSVNPERPFASVVTLQTMVKLLQDDACPAFDRLAFADRMATIFLVRDQPATAAAHIFRGLAVLENALQRWENAHAYSVRLLEMEPEDTGGLLMQLHFATALGKVQDADALKARLLVLKETGKLTVSERETLALYLEN